LYYHKQPTCWFYFHFFFNIMNMAGWTWLVVCSLLCKAKKYRCMEIETLWGYVVLTPIICDYQCKCRWLVIIFYFCFVNYLNSTRLFLEFILTARERRGAHERLKYTGRIDSICWLTFVILEDVSFWSMNLREK